MNDYGSTRDQAVVVEESDRTVLLTSDDTIVIEKGPQYDIAPANRPRKVYSGMWGNAEIATVGLALLAVLSVALLYIFMVVPSHSELQEQLSKRDRLEAERDSARAKYGDITSTETQVAKLVASVDDFESRFLPVVSTGQTALYQRLNGLIDAYGLTNTTGPDYAPLELADMQTPGQSDQERGRSKFRSLFPGVYVTTTVEGSYHNIRRFIREIETGNEFVIISSIELEPSDSEAPEQQMQTADPVQTQAQQFDLGPGFSTQEMTMAQGGEPGMGQRPAAKGKTHGSVVALRLEMAAYFRRPNMQPAAPVQ